MTLPLPLFSGLFLLNFHYLLGDSKQRNITQCKTAKQTKHPPTSAKYAHRQDTPTLILLLSRDNVDQRRKQTTSPPLTEAKTSLVPSPKLEDIASPTLILLLSRDNVDQRMKQTTSPPITEAKTSLVPNPKLEDIA